MHGTLTINCTCINIIFNALRFIANQCQSWIDVRYFSNIKYLNKKQYLF